MAARARHTSETFEQYRSNLIKEDKQLKLRLKYGPKWKERLAWMAKVLAAMR